MPSNSLRAEGAPPRKASGPRRATQRRFSPDLLPLEDRALLSAGLAPTADEQYMLELVNRARANPAAEGQRLLKLAQTDPAIGYMTAGWDLGGFLRQINASGPLPPLAFNTRLVQAARDHDAAMVAANTQFHSPAGYLTDPTIGHAADGAAYYAPGGAGWATGENIFAYSQGVGATTPADYVNYFEAAFLLDWGNPAFGHLKNLMAPGPSGAASGGHPPFSEIGIGLLTNAHPATPAAGGMSVGPAVVTQEFGWRQGNAFLTGVAYTDANNDRFYEPGEGLGGVTITAVGRGGQGTFRVQTWDSGGYSLRLPPGTYTVTATGNVPAARSTAVTIGQDNVAWDALFKPDPPQADIPVPGDYDGTGRSEMAVYRPSTGQWIINSTATGTRVITFGVPNLDIPQPADFDGDGKIDVAVYRPTTGQWFILGSGSGFHAVQWGLPGDIPVPRDYDGAGHAEPAIYRPSDGRWWVLGTRSGVSVTQWGLPGDIPVPRDYNGDGRAEIAIYRPSNAQWWVLGPSGPKVTRFGTPGQDIPVPVNLAGDSRTDLVTYRPATAQWAVQGSSTSFQSQFGRGGTAKPAATWLSPALASNAAPSAEEASGTGASTAQAASPPRAATPMVGPLTRAWEAFRKGHHPLHAGTNRRHG